MHFDNYLEMNLSLVKLLKDKLLQIELQHWMKILICREKDTVDWIVEFVKKERQNSNQGGCQLLCKTSQQ